SGRATLRRAFVLIDARHGVKPVDAEIMALLDEAAVSYQAVLTKADKPRGGVLAEVIADVQAALKKRPAAHPEVLLTSSETGEGLARLRAAILALAA
ncbi:MAG: YihA family ribosome biogenesis GTP-binding protein, partial [Rhodobacterales bacterium CG18_big_fil_WC_8_21_14_2_50_71_9]